MCMRMLRQCLPRGRGSMAEEIDLEELSVVERVQLVQRKLNHAYKQDEIKSYYPEIKNDLKQVEKLFMDDLIATKAEDLLLYTNKRSVPTYGEDDRSKSLTNLSCLIPVETAFDLLTPRHAFSLPNLAWNFTKKGKAKKPKFHKRFWAGVKKFLGKSSNKPAGFTFSEMKAAMGDINNPELATLDISNEDIMVTHLEADCMDMKTSELCDDTIVNNTVSCDGDNVPEYFGYPDISEADAYEICYGPGSPYYYKE